VAEFPGGFNWFDAVVAAGLFYGGWSGLRSGLSGELVTTVGLVLMVVLAILFYGATGAWLAEWVGLALPVAEVIVFVGIAVAVYAAVWSLKHLLHRKLKRGAFSAFVENVGGAVAGVMRWALVLAWLSVCLCLTPSDFWQRHIGEQSRFGSWTVQWFPRVAARVEESFPDKVWFLNEIRRREAPAADAVGE
jgi:uncharacterized membrane protein required for colicin V production